jgi:hypothetical protein
MLQGGSSVPIHAVQGGGGMTDPSVSLLSGGEAARIVPVQGGGAGEKQTDVKEWRPTEEDMNEIRLWAGNDTAMPVYPNKTTAIMLAGKIFMIRDPSRVPNSSILPNEIHQNWQDKILTPGEIDFLKELGVKEPQDLSAAFSPNWGEQIDKFFSSLVKRVIVSRTRSFFLIGNALTPGSF